MGKINYKADEYKSKVRHTDPVKRPNRRSRKSDHGPANMALAIVAAFVTIFMIYNISRSVMQASTKLEIIKYAQQEVQDLRLENIKLVMEKEKMKKDDFVELEARDRLNYTRDGETIYIFSDEIKMRMAENEVEKPISEDCDQLCVIDSWISFVVDGL